MGCGRVPDCGAFECLHGQVFGGEEHLDAARVEQLNVDQDIAPNLPLNNVQLALPE